MKNLAAHRRKRLAAWIREHADSNVTEFARSIDKQQSQLADMLRGAKSFGEKVARDIESRAKMPPGYLDADDAGDQRLMYHGVLLTRSGALLAAEWEKLDLVDRIEIEEEIRRRVQKKVLEHRGESPPKPLRPQPKRD